LECSNRVTTLICIIMPACHSSGRDDALHISGKIIVASLFFVFSISRLLGWKSIVHSGIMCFMFRLISRQEVCKSFERLRRKVQKDNY